ncbi:MAG: MmgE/PrpD family protein [Desulfobacula sp.]
MRHKEIYQTAEHRLSGFAREMVYDQIPEDAVKVVKHILLAVAGTAVAGAAEQGCGPLREMLLDRGGKPEATVLIYGDKLPAPSAALINGVMCRALDFCDAMAPGVHIGSSLIPAALAAAEIRGGCHGKEFLAALTVGAEIGSRLNLTEEDRKGFDPTGVAGVFAATAAAARILELDADQMRNALALAFNRCGGSFQSNVDGSLAVRMIQGWVAESAVTCALLAKKGLTGPSRFLTGVYGYLHLFARGKVNEADLLNGLGKDYLLHKTVFKKYPSCGLTQGVTELALQAASGLKPEPDLIDSVEVRLPPYAHRLVGHNFDIGDNPRVNAQFSAQFCVANAFAKKASTLADFREEVVRALEFEALIRRIKVVSDPNLNSRGHTAVDLTIVMTDGQRHSSRLDIAPGFPGNPLTDAGHFSRFAQCMAYAQIPLPRHQSERLSDTINTLETLKDVRSLVDLMVNPDVHKTDRRQII